MSSREVNGRLVLEGVLTIYWGTETTVRLAETADNRVIARQRKTQSLYLDTRFSSFGLQLVLMISFQGFKV